MRKKCIKKCFSFFISICVLRKFWCSMRPILLKIISGHINRYRYKVSPWTSTIHKHYNSITFQINGGKVSNHFFKTLLSTSSKDQCATLHNSWQKLLSIIGQSLFVCCENQNFMPDRVKEISFCPLKKFENILEHIPTKINLLLCCVRWDVPKSIPLSQYSSYYTIEIRRRDIWKLYNNSVRQQCGVDYKNCGSIQ